MKLKLKNSKNALSAGLILLLFLLALMGCGNQQDNGQAAGDKAASQAPSSAPASAKPAPEASPQTKSFTDPTGTKEIPVNPQRIFSVSATTQLLALGVTPVGGLKYEIEQDYYLKGNMDRIQIAGDYPPNYEAVAALQPDLIIASSFVAPDVVQQLEKIAPTVLYSWESNLYDQLRYVADIVGKKDTAEEWIKKHEAKIAASKEQMKSLIGPDKTVAAIEIFKDKFQIAGNRNVGYVLHDLLGLKRLPLVQNLIEKNGGYLVYSEGMSLEKLPELTSDYIIVKVNDTQPGSVQFFEQMQQSAIWKSLPAVKNGNVFIVPHDKWWSYTLFSTDALLDEAVKLFSVKK